MKFCNLASGSRGNCTIISSDRATVMVDDGLNIRTLSERAREANIDLRKIDAILITHEHTDHVKGVSALVKKYSIPVYCHRESRKGLDAAVSPYVFDCDMDAPFEIGDICVTPFRLPHDSNYNLGYGLSDGRKKIAIATDLGYMNDAILDNLTDSDLVMLESNHDREMLRTGSYPFMLKQRIMGKNGHLSNDECAESIAKLAARGTKHFVLSHLSQDTNTPELAFECTAKALENARFVEGADVYVDTAMQYKATGKIILD